ncbi:uncharacterized protein LOC124979303 [Sciurus carolinensis]|uniref:uncharacterized protein LOC124979303 n=1 Tax=Sciurus carolinensis TaxID=30640 RepID=UPI001FB43665|nr:uncharacterized protein LOC124979303 [Sciurus carolinensis]
MSLWNPVRSGDMLQPTQLHHSLLLLLPLGGRLAPRDTSWRACDFFLGQQRIIIFSAVLRQRTEYPECKECRSKQNLEPSNQAPPLSNDLLPISFGEIHLPQKTCFPVSCVEVEESLSGVTASSGGSSIWPTRDSPGEVYPGHTVTVLIHHQWIWSMNSIETQEEPGPGTAGKELGLRENSMDSLLHTLESDFLCDLPSSMSTMLSSTTQQELELMLESQVTMTGPDMEDQGPRVPDLRENPELMEE